jgi:dTDP-4-dehydrorhamnose 3,5-epimerase
MNFNFTKNHFESVFVIEPKVFADERGGFLETYKKSSFAEAGIFDDFLQDNHSFSTKGVIRGLHFQHQPNPQSKLVRCIKGEIYDCIVDLRKSSPTFKKYFGIILSEKNKLMLYVPVGFAHGFSVLSDEAEVSYKVSAEYDAKCDAGIRFDDPEIAIDWKVKNPIVSSKDQVLPLMKDLKIFF